MSHKSTPRSGPDWELDLVLAGYGGQGVLLAGRLLGSVVVRSRLNVQVNNFYQGFVRGGVSECTIVISEHEIDAPAPKPDVTAVLDIRAAKAWTDKVRPGGLLMRNCSLITDEVCRDDIDVFEIPISDIATEVGNLMCSSMVAVGALASLTGAFRIEDCLEALSDVVPTHRKSLMELNRQALIRGASFVGANRTGVSAHGTV